jgi:hypothetical protein
MDANQMGFEAFPKIPRLTRECIITEKIDGTNAQVIITEDGEITAASRTRLITPECDNYGFAKWVVGNKDELLKLGPGRHFGEWWGDGIGRKYGLGEKRFSLFNAGRWGGENVPTCCYVVPVLYKGVFSTEVVDMVVADLVKNGSAASPGFLKPEGVIIYHIAARQYFKKTCDKDDERKGVQ